ncbi:MAG: exonuclease SbcCD subunit D [Christensenellaceae bacterium]|jgi:exonuclease SbcD
MKFFHLSDLHIGKTVNEFSMLEDQAFVFEQILGHVRAQRPDAVAVAGDVYDKSIPGIAAVRLYDDFLTQLAAENVPVLVISGNHDSPERLEFGGRLMEKSNVYVYGAYDGSVHTVRLEDEWGPVVFHLLPFVRPAAVRGFFPERQIENYEDAVSAAVSGDVLNTAERNILVAHQTVTYKGQALIRSESETDPVGGIGGVDAGIFAAYDYVALGHFHAPQSVGRKNIRYAGSPLKYSLSEEKHTKTVTMVEMKEKGNIEVTQYPLAPLRDMRSIKGKIGELTKEEVVHAANSDDYIYVTLTDEQEAVGAHSRLRSVYPHVMEIRFDNARTRASSDFSVAAAPDVKTAEELFGDFYKEQNGMPLNETQQKTIQALLDRKGGALP